MRPAPPRGAVLAQLWLAWAEFQDDSVPEVSPPGPRPSEWPTCAARLSDADVQSLHVMPRMSVPSAFDPVRMSCSTGGGDPGHCERRGRDEESPAIHVCLSSARVTAPSGSPSTAGHRPGQRSEPVLAERG